MQNLKTVDLCDIPVRVDGEMVCLTDMRRASGSERKNRAVEFLRNDKTAAFVSVLEKVGNPTFYTESGRNGGTWAHKLIAYKYAAWINPEFEVSVYTTLDKFFAGQLLQPQQELHDHLLQCRLSQQIGSFHGRGLNARRLQKAELEGREVALIAKYQYQLSLIHTALPG